ncbi:hypothetical protein [Celeribacter baekdonensis]|nr:hypothetical protein [Celeribacter baekdonensis]|tara:strand:+ start:20871 stop:20996 length:126 start_codon:yes stop_codon:yes gene_type:complete
MMNAVWGLKAVKALSFNKPCFQIGVTFVARQRIKLMLGELK